MSTDLLLTVDRDDQIPAAYRAGPIGDLLRFHNLGFESAPHEQPKLLIGMCMDHRKRLRMPENFAYVLRSGGGNLRYSEFKVSYAIAVGGVGAIALVAHSNCGMVNVSSRREAFVKGLIERGGWQRRQAEEQFDRQAPLFEIADEIEFVLGEARRLRRRYPRIEVAPLYYRVEDGRLYALAEGAGGAAAGA